MNESHCDGFSLFHLYEKFVQLSGITASISFHLISGGGMEDRREDGYDETPPFHRLLLVLLGVLSIFFFFVFVITSLVFAVSGDATIKQIAVFHWKGALPLLLTYRFVWEYLKLSYAWVDEL